MAGVTSGLDLPLKRIIQDGASKSDMEALFRCDYRTLMPKIADIAPVGRRGTADLYPVHEVAQRMGRLTAEQVTKAMKNMHPNDLPQQVSKEFWNAQIAKQTFQKNAGVLWPTEDVIECIAELFKIVKMSTLLMIDSVERNVELSPRQRELVKGAADGMLKDVTNKVETYTEKGRAQLEAFQGADDGETEAQDSSL